MNLFTHLFLISCGASLGAISRHGLTLLLNPLFTFLSFGTLIANYIGCLIMGIMLAMFLTLGLLFSTEYRLFFVTGF